MQKYYDTRNRHVYALALSKLTGEDYHENPTTPENVSDAFFQALDLDSESLKELYKTYNESQEHDDPPPNVPPPC